MTIQILEKKFSVIEISIGNDWASYDEAKRKIEEFVKDGYLVTRSGPIVTQLFSKEPDRFLTRLQKEISERRFVMNKVYISVGFEGFWPVPTAAVVMAENKEEAENMLTNTLLAQGLTGKGVSCVEIDPSEKKVYILSNGDY